MTSNAAVNATDGANCIRVAVVGCVHGKLDEIYADVTAFNASNASDPVRLVL